MKKKVLMWGCGEVARTLISTFQGVDEIEVVGVCIDDEFWKEGIVVGDREVIRFSEAVERFSPDQVNILVAVGFKDLNKVRTEVLKRFLSLGYKPISFIHPTAYVSSSVRLGEHILIMPKVVLEPGVEIGDNVFIWSGAVVCHDVKVERDCFIASGVVIGGGAFIGERSFLGMNAVIRDHRRVGERCIVGAGSYVSRDLHDDHILKISHKSFKIQPIINLPF